MVQTTVEKQATVLEYDLTVGLSAMEGRGFYYPTDTAIAPNGRLYVPNRSVDGATRGVRVTVCDIHSEYYGTFGYFGHDPGEFVWASAITADNEGRLFISDEYTNRITVFDLEGNFQTSLGHDRERRGTARRPIRSCNRSRRLGLCLRHPQPPSSEIHAQRSLPRELRLAWKQRQRVRPALGPHRRPQRRRVRRGLGQRPHTEVLSHRRVRRCLRLVRHG